MRPAPNAASWTPDAASSRTEVCERRSRKKGNRMANQPDARQVAEDLREMADS